MQSLVYFASDQYALLEWNSANDGKRIWPYNHACALPWEQLREKMEQNIAKVPPGHEESVCSLCPTVATVRQTVGMLFLGCYVYTFKAFRSPPDPSTGRKPFWIYGYPASAPHPASVVQYSSPKLQGKSKSKSKPKTQTKTKLKSPAALAQAQSKAAESTRVIAGIVVPCLLCPHCERFLSKMYLSRRLHFDVPSQRLTIFKFTKDNGRDRGFFAELAEKSADDPQDRNRHLQEAFCKYYAAYVQSLVSSYLSNPILLTKTTSGEDDSKSDSKLGEEKQGPGEGKLAREDEQVREETEERESDVPESVGLSLQEETEQTLKWIKERSDQIMQSYLASLPPEMRVVET